MDVCVLGVALFVHEFNEHCICEIPSVKDLDPNMHLRIYYISLYTFMCLEMCSKLCTASIMYMIYMYPFVNHEKRINMILQCSQIYGASSLMHTHACTHIHTHMHTITYRLPVVWIPCWYAFKISDLQIHIDMPGSKGRAIWERGNVIQIAWQLQEWCVRRQQRFSHCVYTAMHFFL